MLTIKQEDEQLDDYLNGLLTGHSKSAAPQMPSFEPMVPYRFGAYVDGQLVGGLKGKHQQGELYISLLAVSDDVRGQGIGKLLLERGILLAKDLGCHHVLLTTYNYQGEGFYEKAGFSKLATIADYPATGLSKIYYIKILKN